MSKRFLVDEGVGRGAQFWKLAQALSALYLLGPTRNAGSLIMDLMADGLKTEEILDQYPGLVPDDIRACVAYAAEMTRERIIVPGRDVA